MGHAHPTRLPPSLCCDDTGENPAFEIQFSADGTIPFPQVILHAPGRQHLLKAAAIESVPSMGTEQTALLATGRDGTGPTIFAPWIVPENPGGKRWGQGCLLDAPCEGVVHTFIYDIAGLKRVTLTLRTAGGEITLPMENQGSYPSQTGAAVTADYYTARLPVGAGDVRYFIEAEDSRGNGSRSELERLYLG